ncbi:MAG: CapA family protein, partial [Oscillospiraceae bacterium]|nr:CapA family protein [Oscillospiraceae bacterium]
MKKILNIVLLFIIIFSLSACSNNAGQPETETTPTPQPTPTIRPADTVSFVAAGDNLIHGSIFLQAARRSTDGGYDFDYAYENTEDYFDAFDVRFINQETLVNDAYAPSHYPQFSTPIALGEKVLEMGFDVIGTSNNHSYDKGVNGIKSSLDYWNSKDVVNVGFYTGDDSKDIKYLTVNNIKMAFLAYTYGTNGLSIYDSTSPYIIRCDDYETVDRQVAIAKENADIVIVSCHWGWEDTNTVNDYQKNVAKHLNEIGVDVIIGTHPHVIQTCEWYTNDVNNHKTLICYSLGNFISGQSKGNNMLGGLFQFNIVKTYDENENATITIEQPYFVPTITHYDYEFSNIRNYILADYTPELAAKHGVKAYDSRFSFDYIEGIVHNVIPEEFLLYK